jgi:hypothetical protein
MTCLPGPAQPAEATNAAAAQAHAKAKTTVLDRPSKTKMMPSVIVGFHKGHAVNHLADLHIPSKIASCTVSD